MTRAKRPRSCGASLPTVRSAMRDAGAVDQPVQAAELLQRGATAALPSASGYVGLDEAAAELARELLAGFGLHVGDDHLAAVLGGHARGAAPRPEAPPVTRKTLFLICIGSPQRNKVMPEKIRR